MTKRLIARFDGSSGKMGDHFTTHAEIVGGYASVLGKTVEVMYSGRDLESLLTHLVEYYPGVFQAVTHALDENAQEFGEPPKVGWDRHHRARDERIRETVAASLKDYAEAVYPEPVDQVTGEILGRIADLEGER